jgi:signal transduction histidine kinase
MRAFSRQSSVVPAGRDLLVIAAVLVIVNAVGALFLFQVYLPRRYDEARRTAPPQLALLARDRQNAMAGWVGERLGDAELTGTLLALPQNATHASHLVDRVMQAYAYETGIIVDGTGTVTLRRGSHETDDAAAVAFAREVMRARASKIDFRLTANNTPRIFTAAPFMPPGGSTPSVVLFVSNPYDYVYPLFGTASVAFRTAETNLIGIYNGVGVALNPYPSGSLAPMMLRLPISKEFQQHALRSGDQSISYVDRRNRNVMAVAKSVPRTPWVLVAKIDEEEVLAEANEETWRLAQLFAVISLIVAMLMFVVLRSRRVSALRAAQDQLARLFENSTTGIITYQVIFDEAGVPVDHEIIDMNPAAEELLGVVASEEIGKRSADAPYLQWTADERARNYDVALSGRALQYEFTVSPGRWFEARSFSPRYGHFAHLFTDVTERRKAEEAIRRLSGRLLRVQDDERRRIARELHDTVAQNLAGVRMNLGVMQRLGDGRTAAAVDDSITATDDAIAQVRTLSYLLHPPMIDQAGLPTALRWYVDGFERRGGIKTELQIVNDLGRVSRDVETSVFRIVQESLTNIQRHSGSTTARILLRRYADHLLIEIADDGRGLPPQVRDDLDALLASGVGIAGINERVHELGGTMKIDSSDNGTTLRVTLPVERASLSDATPASHTA